ncbi:hypothetical protein F444_18856 [Phytophthora nicotianae P1976]|uniref:Uncharacterized protein n=1 Tax=Phytophthora nicotianae P1976 TaxID=1317066 RepID=A0A080Z9X4_PHYNI|nr:hypothetical protein F444_18856 [Phytophthora nicotianae P1976]
MMRNVSIDAADVFFLRLVRVKTLEEQGLSLFPNNDFATCPLLAVTLALTVHATPSPALIDSLFEQVHQTTTALSTDVPLVDLLNAPPSISGLSTPAPPPRAGTTLSIYAHVNRMLDRVAPAAGVSDVLTSHSFRRVVLRIFRQQNVKRKGLTSRRKRTTMKGVVEGRKHFTPDEDLSIAEGRVDEDAFPNENEQDYSRSEPLVKDASKLVPLCFEQYSRGLECVHAGKYKFRDKGKMLRQSSCQVACPVQINACVQSVDTKLTNVIRVSAAICLASVLVLISVYADNDESVVVKTLLCMIPLLNEEEEDLSARGHMEFLVTMLPEDYGGQLESAAFW